MRGRVLRLLFLHLLKVLAQQFLLVLHAHPYGGGRSWGSGCRLFDAQSLLLLLVYEGELLAPLDGVADELLPLLGEVDGSLLVGGAAATGGRRVVKLVHKLDAMLVHSTLELGQRAGTRY